MRYILILTLLLAAGSLSCFEVEKVGDDLHPVYILTDLEGLPSPLFALNREDFEETTARLAEGLVLEQDYADLQEAWKKEQRKSFFQQAIPWGVAGMLAITLIVVAVSK